jgi:hypothetical protein
VVPTEATVHESGETPKPAARRGGRRKVEAAPTAGVDNSAETATPAAEAPAKPASRSRRKPAAAEAATAAVVVGAAESGTAPVEAAPKRRAPARKKPAAAEGGTPAETAGE